MHAGRLYVKMKAVATKNIEFSASPETTELDYSKETGVKLMHLILTKML